jgi:hypothetical protein
MKNDVFWGAMQCGSCKKWRFERPWHLHQGHKNAELGTTLAVASNRSTIEVLRFSVTSVPTRATRRNFPEDTTLHLQMLSYTSTLHTHNNMTWKSITSPTWAYSHYRHKQKPRIAIHKKNIAQKSRTKTPPTRIILRGLETHMYDHL